ncbi:restriction endonuclease [Microbacterium sp. A84]|uniref:restriction endonuclease n=1 Tax=Microbacterium sp. A84 TaxID=3450715 RepID=UPI003F41D6A3
MTPAQKTALDALAERAAAEWLRHSVGWVPVEVNELIAAGLREIDLQGSDASAIHAQVREAARARRNADRDARSLRNSDEITQARIRAQRRFEVESDQRREQEESATQERLQMLRERRRAELEKQEQEEQALLLSRPAPAPDPQPFGVSHEGAEHLVAAWMRHLDVLDAMVTQFSGDGGIDVESAEFIVQVKNYIGSVPVGEVRSIFGVAAAEEKHCLLFTSGTITSEGLIFADRVGMALVRYDAVAGTLAGINELGARAVATSVPEAFGLPG